MGIRLRILQQKFREMAHLAEQVARDAEVRGHGAVDSALRATREQLGQRIHIAEEVARDAEARGYGAVYVVVKDTREKLGQFSATARSRLASPITINVSHSGESATEMKDKK